MRTTPKVVIALVIVIAALAPTYAHAAICDVGRPLSQTTTVTDNGHLDERPDTVLMVGHSNAHLLARALEPKLEAADPGLDLVAATFGGQDSQAWASDSTLWDRADQFLAKDGLAPADVDVVVVDLAHKFLPAHHDDLRQVLRDYRTELGDIIDTIDERYPDVQAVYLITRETGRYSNTKHVEPSAYFHGRVTSQIAAEPHDGFYVEFGPYLWDDPTCTRKDGLATVREDFNADGIHPSTQGAEKLATYANDYFQGEWP